MNILLKSARIVAPASKRHHLKRRDIHIKDGKIAAIAPVIEEKTNMKVLVLKNLHVSPGWFDSSVCFGEPGHEERETIANGLDTAARSGFTDLVLNPNTYPVPDSSSDIVFLRNAGKDRPAVLYPLGTLTARSEGEDLAELFDMHKAGAVGFYDFKQPIRNSNLLKIALLYARNFDGLVCSFPLDVQIAGKGIVNEGEEALRLGLKGIPALAEELQIARDLDILEYTGGSLHIPTISTQRAVKLIAEAKKKGLDVTCSVAIHNLYATDSALRQFDSNFKTMPPLRTEGDAKALIRGVLNGVIDFVTTDHTPLDVEEKRVEFDNAAYGTIGLESALGVMLQLFDLETAVGLLCKGRGRFGIPAMLLEEGQMANLTLFDPEASYVLREEELNSTSKNCMFLGDTLKGKVYGVLAHGKTMLPKNIG
jgi:dihydroorotase